MADPTTSAAVADLTRVLDLVGVAGNALVGATLARTMKIDIAGFLVLGIVSGLGGGILRDTLLQQGTPAALTDYWYLPLAVGASLFAFVLHLRGRLWDYVYVLVDALALGCWAAAGAQKTLSAGLGWLPAVLLGTITVVGGGILRDVLIQRTPQILRNGPMYAGCAAVASGVLVILTKLDHPQLGTACALLIGASLCLLARRRNWRAPQPLALRVPLLTSEQ